MPPRKKPEEPKTATELAIEEQEKIAKKASKDAEDKLKLAELQAKNQAIAQQEAHAQQHTRAHPHSTNANYPFGAFGLNHGVPHLPVVAVPPHQPLHHPQQVQTSWSRAQHQDMQEQEYWQDQRTRARNTRHGNWADSIAAIAAMGIGSATILAILYYGHMTANAKDLIGAVQAFAPNGLSLTYNGAGVTIPGTVTPPPPTKEDVLQGSIDTATGTMNTKNAEETRKVEELTTTSSALAFLPMIKEYLGNYVYLLTLFMDTMVLESVIDDDRQLFFTQQNVALERRREMLEDKLNKVKPTTTFIQKLKEFLQTFNIFTFSVNTETQDSLNSDEIEFLKLLEKFEKNVATVFLVVILFSNELRGENVLTRQQKQKTACLVKLYKTEFTSAKPLFIIMDQYSVNVLIILTKLDQFISNQKTLVQGEIKKRSQFFENMFPFEKTQTQFENILNLLQITNCN
jgi:hypothetical protein